MKIMPLKAVYREENGKQAVKKVRARKQIPAVAYGSGIEPTSIAMSLDDFLHAVHTKAGENVIIELTVEGSKNFKQTVVIKEIQHHPTTDAIEHVDFQTVSLKEKIKVKVPLRTTGEAVGVKEGGILDVVHHEIDVECLPTDIPNRIDVDIAEIKIGAAIHVQEVKFPQGVAPLLPPDEVLVAVHAPKAEEAAPAEAAAAPEMVGKEKKEGEEAKVEAAPKGEEAKQKGEAEQKKK